MPLGYAPGGRVRTMVCRTGYFRSIRDPGIIFGDGGLLTFGANCFNMAIVLPLVGYFIYKVISSNSEAASSRRLLAAVIGSYFAIVIASFFTGLELGIQPTLFHTANGTPLYAPYALGVTLPAMLLGHLLIAGPVEAVATGGVFAYLQRSHSSLINADTPKKKEGKVWLLWGALGVAVIATPLGLLASGTAWGEWGIDELQNMGLGFIPQDYKNWPAGGRRRCLITAFPAWEQSSVISCLRY